MLNRTHIARGLAGAALFALAACGGSEYDAAYDDVGEAEGAIIEASPNSAVTAVGNPVVSIVRAATDSTPTALVGFIAYSNLVSNPRADSSPDPIPARVEDCPGRAVSLADCDRIADPTRRDSCRRFVLQHQQR